MSRDEMHDIHATITMQRNARRAMRKRIRTIDDTNVRRTLNATLKTNVAYERANESRVRELMRARRDAINDMRATNVDASRVFDFTMFNACDDNV